MLIATTTDLRCLLILPKFLIKSNHLVLTKEFFINHDINITMTNENYVVAFQQKIVKKEATTQKWDV
jgi:hypothetical protein